MDTKEKVASIVKHKGEREKLVRWLATLPGRITGYEKRLILETVKRGQYILWTSDSGLRIL